MKYELFEYEDMGTTYTQIVRTDDDGSVWYIPGDESNSDYQAYLAWVEENK